MPPPSANKGAHSGFEPQRKRHQKSKISVAPTKRTHVIPKFIFKKIYNIYTRLSVKLNHLQAGYEAHRFYHDRRHQMSKNRGSSGLAERTSF